MHDALKNSVEKAGIPKVDETSWGCYLVNDTGEREEGGEGTEPRG